MKRMLFTVATVVVLLGGLSPALASEQTVTLKVDMWCPTCPIIVKRVLKDVDGVSRVEVSYARKTVVVTFDDGKASVAALTAATTDVGFPSIALDASQVIPGGWE